MDIFITTLGYLAAFCLVFVSIPTFLQVVKTKKTSHLNFKVLIIFELACLMFILSGTYTLITTSISDVQWFFNLAVCLANYISFFITGLVLLFKWKNKLSAKKKNMTEIEFDQKKHQ